jgi:hypothetical protein
LNGNGSSFKTIIISFLFISILVCIGGSIIGHYMLNKREYLIKGYSNKSIVKVESDPGVFGKSGVGILLKRKFLKVFKREFILWSGNKHDKLEINIINENEIEINSIKTKI